MSKTQQIDRIISAIIYAAIAMLIGIAVAAMVLICILEPYVLMTLMAFLALTAAFYFGGSKYEDSE